MTKRGGAPTGCALFIPFIIITIILGTISIACLQFIRAGIKMYDPKNCVEAVFIEEKNSSPSDGRSKTVKFTYEGKEYTDRANFSEYHKVGDTMTVYLHKETKQVSERSPLLIIVPTPVLLGAVGFWLFVYKRLIVERGRNIDWSDDGD